MDDPRSMSFDNDEDEADVEVVDPDELRGDADVAEGIARRILNDVKAARRKADEAEARAVAEECDDAEDDDPENDDFDDSEEELD